MSADDQALSIGKTVLEYVESKRKVATLRADIARIAQQFENGATILRERVTEPAIVNEFIGLTTYERLRALIDDLHTETRRHEKLLKSVRDIGMEG